MTALERQRETFVEVIVAPNAPKRSREGKERNVAIDAVRAGTSLIPFCGY